ncbi:hypothetical protein [Clostridium sp. 1001283B150210_160208_E6]|uniref:hypothetical protein n=1 Tax=Clostridium sp. 1001283B150210_160208_E6 TaxID=2787129 RepID=UPI0018AC5805|nr:hypothetical protein [Clostridium sp. 1001283B150210_160208_E6]
MDANSLAYIKAVNGTNGKSCVDSFRDEMIQQYNEANKNVITEFSILINSDKAKSVKINNTPNKVLIKYNKKEIQVKAFVNSLNSGDYIYYTDEEAERNHIYLNTSTPKRIRDYEYHLVEECEQELSFSFTKNPIPCIAEGESYGVKITGGTEFNAQVDTKVKVTVQDNAETRKLKPDHRFIFNNSEYGIYKIGDITVYNNGLLTFTCQKDQYQKGYDDLENNIAYNGVIPDEPTEEPKPVTYKIIGCDSDNMVINTTEIFTLEPQNNNVEWKLNEEYEVGVAEIISTNDSSCTVKCLKADNVFELKALIDNEEVGSRVIFTSKR